MAPTDSLADEQIVVQVLSGQPAEYRLLVERHSQAVFNAAYRLLGQADEAADVTQETFVRAYTALASFQQDKPLAPWLCRIAINLALNRLKQYRPTVSLDSSPGLDLPDPAAEPHQELVRAERQQALRRAILALPPEQRLVIELRHFQEQSYEEIATTLGISLASVKSRLFRARHSLREALREDEVNL